MNEQARITPPVTSSEQYFVVRDDGHVRHLQWTDRIRDYRRWNVGNVFRNEDAAQAFVDFLKAVEVVRHDKGFRNDARVEDCVYTIVFDDEVFDWSVKKVRYSDLHCGAFYFDTEEHCRRSIENHNKEWTIIDKYDWSKE